MTPETARRGALWGALTCLVSLVVGLGVQVPCLTAGPNVTGTRACYSDLVSLYRLRGLRTHTFPYLHVGAFGFPRGTVEYPTLTALFAWLTALPVDNPREFLLVSVAVLSLVALGAAMVLGRDLGRAAWWFTLSPALALHAFQNWDLLPVAATVLGIAAWWSGHRTAAAVWFAVGACLKVYPGFFLLAMVAEALQRKDRRAALRDVLTAAVVVVVTNGPFLLLAPRAWWQVWTFQAQRPIDISAMSVWTLIADQIDIPIANLGALVTCLVGVLVVLYVAGQRAVREGAYPVLPAGAALVVVFIVTQKACSPQDMLWIAPFFAVLAVRLRWFVATAAVDLLATGSIFWVLYEHPEVQKSIDSLPVSLAILFRAAVLVCLVPVFVQARARVPLSLSRPRAVQPAG